MTAPLKLTIGGRRYTRSGEYELWRWRAGLVRDPQLVAALDEVVRLHGSMREALVYAERGTEQVCWEIRDILNDALADES